jgi:uncharacterized membrane protein
MAVNPLPGNPQEAADRIGVLREELAEGELAGVLALTPDQRARVEEWSRAKLAALAQEYDVDTTQSQKRVSWGLRITSTLGALALCAAVVLFFNRYWGYLEIWEQLTIVILTPLLLVAGAEYAARRERTRYFTGLLALVALASFVLNLVVLGTIFNVISTERALLPWGAFAMVLAYRYRLRLLLALGLVLLMAYVSAVFTVEGGYYWADFYDRPERSLILGLIAFALPFWRGFGGQDFAPVYRLTGALAFFISILSLAEWGVPSYLPWSQAGIERFYEIAGLLFAAAAIWLGIRRNWSGIVNAGAVFFTLFLFTRLYHLLWDSMPKYLFFAVTGALGIALVAAFKRVRSGMAAV